VISAEDLGGAVRIRMDDGKANAIQARFLADFNAALDAAGADSPLVVTGTRRIFSAGLDLPELSGLSRAEMGELMADFRRTMLRVFLHPAPVVCAVNGHAIAGGCLLALQGDRRLMVEGDGKIGVNEIQLGLSVPAVAIETFRAQLSPAALAAAALEGRLFSPAEAAALGIVDEVAPPEDLEARAGGLARHLASGGAAFRRVKLMLRRPAAEAIERSRDEDDLAWLDEWFSEAAQRRIAETVERLKTRRSG
jgi:enoyl-CoA hydratase